jgi:hypothetical protein
MAQEALQHRGRHSPLVQLLIAYALGAGALVLIISELAGCVFNGAWRTSNSWWSLQLGRHYTDLYRIAAVTVVFSLFSVILVAVAIVINVRFPDKKRIEFVFWLLGYLCFFITLMCEGASIDYTKYGNMPVVSHLNLLTDRDFNSYYRRYIGYLNTEPVSKSGAEVPYKEWSKVLPTHVLINSFLDEFVKSEDHATVDRIYRRTDLSAYMQPFYGKDGDKDPVPDECVSCAINWSTTLKNGAITGTNPCNWDFSKVPTANHMCIGGWTPQLLQEYWCERYTEAKADDDCDIAHSGADDWTCVKERAVRERARVTQYSLAAMHQNNRLLIGVQIVAFVV